MVKYLDNNSGFNQWRANQEAAKKKSPFGFLWWVALFFATWWLVGAFTSPGKNKVQEEAVAVVEDLSSVPTTVVSSDNISASIQGLRISDIALSNYALKPDSSEPVSLLSSDGEFIEVGVVSVGGADVPVATTVWRQEGDVYKWRGKSGIDFTRNITVDGYVVTVTDEIKNNSSSVVSVAPFVRIVRELRPVSSAGVATGSIAYVNSDIEREAWTRLDKKSYAYSTTNGFIGFADQYWETIASIDVPDQTMRVKKDGKKYISDVVSGAVSIAPGASDVIKTKLYVGPRDQGLLDDASAVIEGIDETVDYGWFWFLARPMLWVLNALNSIVMNYGIAIILFTLFLRLLLWPLTRKSYVSMIAMQKMQPEMQRIQKLYANDKARLQMEMLRLYQTHKTSPMSGCLPMLIQIPVFFALYKALLVSVPMRNAHFLWISDLAAMDPYFILPILMGVTMWWQQQLQSASKKLSSDKNDPVAQTQRMMKWMPVLFTIMFAWMPAGLVLYWTVSNVFGIAQMYIIKKKSK